MAVISSITSTGATGLAIGPNGSTNPVLVADCSVASAAAGLKVIGRAAAAGADLVVVSSGTNENLKIDAKGSGTVTINGTATGAVTLGAATAVTGAITGTSTSASALTVGANGATNPVLKVNANTASVATGLHVTGAAAAGGLAVSVISSGTNENLTIDAKGSGTVSINATGTGGITLARAVTASSTIAGANSILSSHATAGVGYATGAGGAVTQITSRTTGVTVNKAAGAITLVSAAGSTTSAAFTVTNSAVAATDVVVLSQKSGTDKYRLDVTAVGAGSFEVSFSTISGTTTEQPVFNFAVIKAVAA